MPEPNKHTPAVTTRYYQSIMLPVIFLVGVLLIAFSLQVIGTLNARRVLAPLSGHIAQLVSLQDIHLSLQQELIESLRANGVFTTAERQQMFDELKAIIASRDHLNENTPQVLTQAQNVLADVNYNPKQALIVALSHTRKALGMEAIAHQRQVNTVDQTLAVEFRTSILTLVLLPVGIGIILYLMRRRILQPLQHLGYLMTLLARRDYSPAPVTGIDAMLRPLTENYNTLVTRLAALEEEHAAREQNLEAQVRQGARALLEQQRNLANSERLATVGETMARVAHELRNPLAGVKLACTNLRRELNRQAESADYVQRLDSVTAEVDRIVSLLNALLEQARHQPEALRDVALAQTVKELIALGRYQIPDHIRLEQRIADTIACRLPDAMLRQALLNLLLNAGQAIGESAGVITVRATVDGGTLVLSVEDDGPGLPDDLLQTGIRAFVTHKQGGTGLGLSMVQRFAREMDGTINLENVAPHGACVTLKLPCGKSDV